MPADAPLPLTGRAALVTGGGTGIGRACAEALVADGATVTIVGRRVDVLEAAAAEIRTTAPAGAEVRWAAADVAEDDQMAAAVATASEGVGLDMAVLSAGTGTLG
ncbi:MAG TPA: SDR family NAD(P)-dependent oxidoreductase, partial [Iamia sp.]|nr:SDR family NAD(P)-dependent oxidoreductase [Iamia sp.]